MIKVLFFAQLAEDAQSTGLDVAYRPDLTARSLVTDLEPLIANKAIDQLRHDFVILSVNQQLAGWDDQLTDGDEIGFLPPFSGG